MLVIGRNHAGILDDVCDHIMPQWVEEIVSRFMESESRVTGPSITGEPRNHPCWFTEYRFRSTPDPNIFLLQANFWTNPFFVPRKVHAWESCVITVGYRTTMTVDLRNEHEVTYEVRPRVRRWEEWKMIERGVMDMKAVIERIAASQNEETVDENEFDYVEWCRGFDKINSGFDRKLLRSTTDVYRVEDLEDWEFGEVLIDEVAQRAASLFMETRKTLAHVFAWTKTKHPDGFDLIQKPGSFDRNRLFQEDAFMLDPLGFTERFTNFMVTRDQMIVGHLDRLYAAMTDAEMKTFYRMFPDQDIYVRWSSDNRRPNLVPMDTAVKIVAIPYIFRMSINAKGFAQFNPYLVQLGAPDHEHQSCGNEDDLPF